MTSIAPVYAQLYQYLCAEAKGSGYALAIHGSLNRDLDLVAIPWTDEAEDSESLIKSLSRAVGCGAIQGPYDKPHGRRSWAILLGGDAYIDLSVMPRESDMATKKAGRK